MISSSFSLIAIRLAIAACMAQGTPADVRSQDSRRTPIVEAIEKTRPGIVTIRTANPKGGNDLIGAGVIIDPGGYIVTNFHVVGKQKKIKVRLHDGTDLTGDVLRTDPDFDLALVAIKTTKKLTALRINAANKLLVGETVFAIGHPFGYEGTVSRGIISALDRELTMPNDVLMKGLIQHDAPINPGNSGGPLVNLKAEVIGINFAMRDGAQNISFAMNSETIDEVLSNLVRSAKIACHHGLTCEIRRADADLPLSRLVVTEVCEQSPAAKAGGQVGDTILRVADEPVLNRLDMERAFWHRKSGERITVAVRRNGRDLALLLVVGDVPK